jgi:hypothetical protein
MALTVDGLLSGTRQKLLFAKTAAVTTVANLPYSTWDTAGNPGAGSLSIGSLTPGVVPTDAIAGAPFINPFSGGLSGYLARLSAKNSVPSWLILYDRLFHAGSFVTTAAQTNNLSSQPSYAGRLPAGDYSGLEILLEVNVAISNTAENVTVTYTKEDGTTGRSTGPVSVQNLPTRRLVQMPLQAGDKGVQKIESVITSAAVAAGSLNVIVARRLAEIRINAANAGEVQGVDKLLTEIFDTSCLMLAVQADSTSGGLPDLAMDIVQG